MTCELYRQHELGELDTETFTQHLHACAECQKLKLQDEQLLSCAKTLQRPSASSLLWAKIENALRTEQQRDSRLRVRFTITKKHIAYAVAASLILAIGLGVFFKFNDSPQDLNRVLAAAALQRVEEKEREYETAIAELERVATPQLTELDMDLMLLYRDRLETIEAQIARCRIALAENPGNAHIRRYLLIALQDKKETLLELASQREG